MTHEQYLQLSENAQSVFASKLIHAIRNNSNCFLYANYIVEAAQTTGMFKDVKFGSEAYIPQVIGFNNELS